MKKNISSIHKPAIEQQISLTGLFSNRQSRERIMEQLKRGTLFRFNQKKEQARGVHAHKDEAKTFLDDIKLGLERQEQRVSTTAKEEIKEKKENKLPCIMKSRQTLKENKKEKRCDKTTCMTKKLAKIAAWNKDNSHNIDKNVERLERSLHLDEKSLSQNDFWRVQGVNCSGNKSLQTSLIEMDKSSILEDHSGFNPFSNFPNFSDTIRPKSKKHKTNVDRSHQKRQQLDSGNYFIPEFLMNSIVVTSPKKNELKRVVQ